MMLVHKREVDVYMALSATIIDSAKLLERVGDSTPLNPHPLTHGIARLRMYLSQDR